MTGSNQILTIDVPFSSIKPGGVPKDNWDKISAIIPCFECLEPLMFKAGGKIVIDTLPLTFFWGRELITVVQDDICPEDNLTVNGTTRLAKIYEQIKLSEKIDLATVLLRVKFEDDKHIIAQASRTRGVIENIARIVDWEDYIARQRTGQIYTDTEARALRNMGR